MEEFQCLVSSQEASKRGQQETRSPQELEKLYKSSIGNNYPYDFEDYRGFKIHRMSVHYYNGTSARTSTIRLLRDEYVVSGGRITNHYQHRFRTEELAKSNIDASPDATPLSASRFPERTWRRALGFLGINPK